MARMHNSYSPTVELANNALAAMVAKDRQAESNNYCFNDNSNNMKDNSSMNSQQFVGTSQTRMTHHHHHQGYSTTISPPLSSSSIYTGASAGASAGISPAMHFSASNNSYSTTPTPTTTTTTVGAHASTVRDSSFYYPPTSTTASFQQQQRTEEPNVVVDSDVNDSDRDEQEHEHEHSDEHEEENEEEHTENNSINKITGQSITSTQMQRSSRRKKPTPADPGWTALHHRRHFVRHNYHDHAHDKEESPIYPGSSTNGGTIDEFTAKGGVSLPFPLVLHSMLDAMENSNDAHIVSWQPHGRSFCVHDSKAFVTTVMPRWFRQSKISSFQRQLNLYGFSRLTSQGADRGAYYNEYFLRGRPDLTVHMHRTRVKGTGVRTSSNPMEEPNFYEMEAVGGAKKATTKSNVGATTSATTSSTVTSRECRHSDAMMALNNSSSSTPSPSDYLQSAATTSMVVNKNNDMMITSMPQREQQPSSRPTVVPNMMDLDDVDVKDMAIFLEDVDLSSDPNNNASGDAKSIFGMYTVDLSRVYSTSV